MSKGSVVAAFALIIFACLVTWAAIELQAKISYQEANSCEPNAPLVLVSGSLARDGGGPFNAGLRSFNLHYEGTSKVSGRSCDAIIKTTEANYNRLIFGIMTNKDDRQ